LFRRFDEKKALDGVIWKLIFDIEKLQRRVTVLESKIKALKEENN